MLVGFFSWSAINFDSTRDAILYLKGMKIVAEPTVFHVAAGRAGEVRNASFQVRNLTSKPITVLGARTSCSCVATESLPILIPPGSEKTFGATLRLDGASNERIDQSVQYVTDLTDQPLVNVRITGSVSE